MKDLIHPLLAKLLGNATRLTHTGRLGDATAAIQRALRSAGLTTGPTPAARSAGAVDRSVFDGLVREADAPPRRAAPTPAQPTPRHDLAEPFGSGSFSAESGTRQYKLFVPRGFDGERLPLVVMLHGCTQNPDDFAAGTRMNVLAQEAGVIVLYPAQAARSNSSKCWNWFQPADQRRGQGEPGLLAGMTRHVIATQAVDADRVYVAGLSAGGAMAAIMGREYPDLYAAIGVHSGLPAGAATDIASAFVAMKGGAGFASPGAAAVDSAWNAAAAPTIAFHGDRDTTVHPDNGAQVVGGEAAAGARRDEAGRAGRHYTRSVFSATDGRVRAEHWLVHGAGHAWSGGSAEGSFADALGPDASREMLRFFLEHPRRAAAQA